jgi:hypothetical protein
MHQLQFIANTIFKLSPTTEQMFFFNQRSRVKRGLERSDNFELCTYVCTYGEVFFNASAEAENAMTVCRYIQKDKKIALGKSTI